VHIVASLHISRPEKKWEIQPHPTPGQAHFHDPPDWMHAPAPGQQGRLIGLLAPHACEESAHVDCIQLQMLRLSKASQPSGLSFRTLHMMVAE